VKVDGPEDVEGQETCDYEVQDGGDEAIVERLGEGIVVGIEREGLGRGDYKSNEDDTSDKPTFQSTPVLNNAAGM
jgi:hypothetical protein